METAPQRILVRIGGEQRGPFTPAQLRELAEVAVITPATEAAETPAGPWAPLATLPWSADLFPKRPEMGFRAAEFEKTNRDSVAPVDHRELIEHANRPPSPGATQRAAERAAAAPPEPARKIEAPNEIVEMVQGVARRQADIPQPLLPPLPRRGTKHLVHFIVLLVAGNATLAAVPWYYGGPFDEFTVLVLISWHLIYTIGVAFAMIWVLPRY
jgi:hypothetical protein